MATKTFGDDKDDTSPCCPICFDVYDDPRSLVCLHTFCERCISAFVVNQQNDTRKILKNAIECPLCRKLTRVKSPDVPAQYWSKTIPVNFALKEVLESLSIGRSRESEQICTVHGKPFEFYSSGENTLCCSSCAVNRLKEGQEICELKEIAEEEITKRHQPLQNEIQKLNLRTSNLSHFLDKCGDKMEKSINVVEAELKEIHDKIIEKLEQNRALILSSAIHSKYQIDKQNINLKEQCLELKRQLDLMSNEVHLSLQLKSPQNVLIAIHVLEEKVIKLKRRLDELILSMKYLEFDFQKDEFMKKILESDLNLGTMNAKEISPKESNFDDYRLVKLFKAKSIDIYATAVDEKQPLFSGMDFMPDGRLVLVDNANWKCLVLDKRLEFVACHQFDKHIFDVVSASNDEIYVTGARMLETVVVNSEARFFIIDSLKLKSCPFSISMYDNNSFVVGTYRSNKPAILLTKSGVENDIQASFPEKLWKIDDSRCAYDCNRHLLVLTDRFEDCIYIYNLTFRNEIRVKDERIIEPRGVAIGPRDCIFVCSKGTNSIVQMSLYGEILAEHKLDITYPCSLCFSKDYKKLAVSNSFAEAKKLIIFKVK